MSSAVATIVFGLIASLCWGSGDFCGGLASRRTQASTVVAAAYAVGFVLLTGLAILWREPFPSIQDILWGLIAGVIGGLGLIAFYSALSTGRMGIIAPTAAVLTAGLPVIFSLFTQGLPTLLQVGGFIVALVAIVLISRPEKEEKPAGTEHTHSTGNRLKRIRRALISENRPKGIGRALISGCCFGIFFILISRVSHNSTYWPLAAARLSAVIALLILAFFRKQQVLPKKAALPLILLSGTLDALGNAFFVLAAHSGRLDIASILSSLYPAATVLLAMLVLRERANRVQGLGILIALVAIVMISA